MVATEFLHYIQSFSAANYVGFEDLADRANFQWNVIVILLCMVLVTVRQYFMSPLVCYLPTTVSGINAESYVTNLCWIEGTFPINWTSGAVPHSIEEWDSLKPNQMNYYQWVPLVLGLQAILYYIPRLIWSVFTYNRTGTDLQNLVRTANAITKEEGDKRTKMVDHIGRTLELLLFNRREYRTSGTGVADHFRRMSIIPGKRHGNKLIYVYLGIKLLYAIVGLCQLYLMYVFLRFDSREGYFFFGFRVLNDIVSGNPWTETQVFPRVGMCRQTLQHVGASNKLFAQCVLPINMLNEKIYVFLYFFLGTVTFLTFLSIPLWIWRMGLKKRQRHFVRRFLKIADVYERGDYKMNSLIDRFITEFLRQDGHFILRMLSMNAGDLVTVEIVCRLFAGYKKDFSDTDFRGPPSQPGPPYALLNSTGHPHSGHGMNNAAVKPGRVTNHNDFIAMRLEPGSNAQVRQRSGPTAPAELEALLEQIQRRPSTPIKDAPPQDAYPMNVIQQSGVNNPDGTVVTAPRRPSSPTTKPRYYSHSQV